MASLNEKKLPSLGIRIIGGLLLFGVVLAFAIFGGMAFSLFILLLGIIAEVEFSRLMAYRDHRLSPVLLILWMVGVMATHLYPAHPATSLAITLLLLLTFGWMVFRFARGDHDAVLGFALTLAGGFLLGWSLAHIITLRGLADGLFWCLILVFATSGADTGAYFAGSLFGRHPFFQKISPKKTVEGFVGGIIIGPLLTGGVMLLCRLLGAGPEFTFVHGLVLGACIAPFAPLGDLGVSVIKRYAGVKDTGTIIPGHGGILDRLDSYLVTAPVFLAVLTLLLSGW